MGMRVSEKRILNDHAGIGAAFVEVLTAVLLNVFAWLTYFSFLRIDLLRPAAAGSTTGILLCLVFIPLLAALLSGIPKYGERQLFIWLVPELALFLITAISSDPGGGNSLVNWWRRIFPTPNSAALLPFSHGENAYLSTTLMFLAILLLSSSLIADDLRLRRRGVPLLLTLVPILFFIFSDIKLPKDGGFHYRWYLGIYLAILIYAVIFSIGKEKPRAFWKKHINMGLSVLLISAVILAAIVGVYQNKDPNLTEKMQNRTPQSSMSNKTKKLMEKSGMPLGDVRNANEQPKQSTYFLYVTSDKPLVRPVYFRVFTGEAYKDGKWGVINGKSVPRDVKQKLMPALITGQLAGNEKAGTLTIRVKERGSTQAGINSAAQYVKTDSVFPTYETIYDSEFRDMATARLPRDFFKDTFKLNNSTKSGYTLNIANVNTASYAMPLTVPEEYRDAERGYYSFVKQYYGVHLNSSEQNVLNSLRKLGWSPTEKSMDSARQDVENFLNRNFKVINTPLRVGKNDPLLYAVSVSPDPETGKREINQIHMASLEALLLRSEGIPARYVEGFQLAPESTKKDKNGAYILDHKSAHVWCEVYIQHKGWLPVEFGPVQNVGAKNEPKQMQKGQAGNQSADLQKKTATVKKKTDSARFAWMVLLYILLAAIIITLLVFAVLAFRKKRTLRKLEESYGRENTFRGYRILIKDLRRKNYPASPQHPDWLIPFLGDEYRKYLDYVYEERYSEPGLNSEERRFCTDFVLTTIETTRKLKKKDRE